MSSLVPGLGPLRKRTGYGANWAAFVALWRLSFRNAFSFWRLLLLLVLGSGLVGLTAATTNGLRNSSERSASDIEEVLNAVVGITGLAVILPVVALLFAGAALGELRDEKSLVYVWLSPTSRLLPPLAATLAAFVMVAPITTASLALSAAVADIGDSYIVAVTVATVLGALAYCGLFVAGSLFLRRILGWGLGYVLVWESLVGSLPGPLGQLSLRRYTASIVAQWGEVSGSEGTTNPAALSVALLLSIAVAAVIVAAVRLARMTID